MAGRIRWAPKIRVETIVRLYTADAEMRHDDELVDDLGWRLLARAQDVLLVSDSKAVCPDCGTTFAVAWIGEQGEHPSSCPTCGWRITAADYHASFEHRDLNGAGARDAFAEYVAGFPRLTTYAERMMAIDRLVHAVHTTGGLAARNLFEGRARDVLATLDSLAASPARVPPQAS
jgi:predicted Zn-ribbon and HTH transcriptional regulator